MPPSGYCYVGCPLSSSSRRVSGPPYGVDNFRGPLRGVVVAEMEVGTNNVSEEKAGCGGSTAMHQSDQSVVIFEGAVPSSAATRASSLSGKRWP